ncbi:radical SAM family heme chaperone HemW [Lachnobacterium bovis]|uniref:Heme chaperone HemW n=1 Tax=Lachnobacterium bovis TaxID=140626 RepID=A0A1H9RFL2_9FIRM|nr:radical SAM family heme chaperone HemW [Lachnobacterium bovis]SER71335.1 oxygen-independent coproporphyrinogen-3 oxidase [Lachnobacterium bovis]
MKELELYIHIPFCIRKCEYCDFLSFPANAKTQKEYVDALIKEILYYAPKFKNRKVVTIFFGGGTPSWLDYKLLVSILDTIKANYDVADDAEITLEANPGTVVKSAMESYKKAGINRLSIGLQSTKDNELKILGRVHNYEQFLKIYHLARKVGFDNINIDLMSGLPYQNIDDFMKSLNEVIRLKPEHLSVYTLIIEKGTPFYDKYKFDDVKQHAGMVTEALPSEDDVYTMYKLTQQTLKNAGYMQYETSNFAKKGLECRHNIGYWQRKDYLGLGLGAASLVDNVRYSNKRDIYDYVTSANKIQKVELSSESDRQLTDNELDLYNNLHDTVQILSKQEQMEEFMFLGLRMNQGISRSDFEENFNLPIEGVYKKQIDKLKQEGLLEVKHGQVYLTDKGSDLANYCMAQFV